MLTTKKNYKQARMTVYRQNQKEKLYEAARNHLNMKQKAAKTTDKNVPDLPETDRSRFILNFKFLLKCTVWSN